MSKRELERIERQLLKINEKITKAGFTVYLSNDTLNIMKGPTHNDNDQPIKSNIVHSIWLKGWDGGDW